MSLFRIVKYSSILFFLNRHRNRLFQSLAVLLFALVTSLLYEDLRHYLELRHPGTLVYALIAKILIVYGSLAFVLWQFRPGRSPGDSVEADRKAAATAGVDTPGDRLEALNDIERQPRLRSRYEQILEKRASGNRNGNSPTSPPD